MELNGLNCKRQLRRAHTLATSPVQAAESSRKVTGTHLTLQHQTFQVTNLVFLHVKKPKLKVFWTVTQ